MKDLFFVYCNESGFELFETLDDALDAANERVQGYLEDAWSDEVTSVCAGKITHRAKMCDQVFPDGEIDEDGFDEAGDYWGPDCDYKCNYKMLPVERNPVGWVVVGPGGFVSDIQTDHCHAVDLKSDMDSELPTHHTGPAHEVKPLYLHPQPAPEVALVEAFDAGQRAAQADAAVLAEALECCITSMLDAGFNKRFTVITKGWKALAAYRKQKSEEELSVDRQERMHKLRSGSDTAIWAAEEIDRLMEDLARCRHQSSYSIGCKDALNRYESIRDNVGGCGDGSCLIKKPSGMATNGGCRCTRDPLKTQRMMMAAQELFNRLTVVCKQGD